MSFSANEFVVYVTINFANWGGNADIEYYCLQAPSCSYIAATKINCAKSEAATLWEFRSNVVGLNYCNLIELADASAIYNNCTDCAGAIMRYVPGPDRTPVIAACPIGTEMVITTFYKGSGSYWYDLDPRTKLVNDELPSNCLKRIDRILCSQDDGNFELRFTRADEKNYCDASDESKPCPIPVSGYPYGDCAATQPCPVARALAETEELN